MGRVCISCCAVLSIGYTKTFLSLAWSPVNSNVICAGCNDKSVYLWDMRMNKQSVHPNLNGNDKVVAHFSDVCGPVDAQRHAGDVVALEPMPGTPYIASLGSDGSVIRWDVNKMTAVNVWISMSTVVSYLGCLAVERCTSVAYKNGI